MTNGAADASALAVRDGRFVAVGGEADVRAHRGERTQVIDAGGRRIIPGLNDSHIHVIRGGLNYNLELRWDGVPSLADALAGSRSRPRITPPPQWVRVVGGWSEFQFAERRMPTLAEINAAAPDTPVFVLHLYDRAWLNGAALRAVGYTKDTPDPPGGEIERDRHGNPTGLLIARPNANILYATLAKGPRLGVDDQINSTRHFMRELNRLGLTSIIDAGGGFQNYPDDYAVVDGLHKAGQLTLRIAYNLFTQKPKAELDDFQRWTGDRASLSGRRLLPHERRRRDARLLGRRLRRLSRAPSGPRAGDGGGPRRRRAAPGRAPLAVPPARHLRRVDLAVPRRLRAREPRCADRSAALVPRSRRDHLAAEHRAGQGARRRHRRPAPDGVPGRVLRRAATAPAPPSRRRRSAGCSTWACRSGRAPTPRGSPATTRGSRCTGSSPAAPSAAWRSIPRRTCSTAPPRCG